jgi:biotin transport system substrate-specific component
MLSIIAVRRWGVSHLVYVGGIVLFAAFTALTARITVPLPFTPVPVTLQVMAVLLAGLVLGARGGALSQIAYLAAIAAGLPLDAYGRGPAALMGPTAGYLVGFVAAAFVTGWLAGRLSADRTGRLVAALGGVAVVYACGSAWLTLWTGSLSAAWALGVTPFLAVDVAKALLAAAVAESGRQLLRCLGGET